jgi:hypothetical protein
MDFEPATLESIGKYVTATLPRQTIIEFNNETQINIFFCSLMLPALQKF